jgi:anti-sigma factor RsiW
MSDCTRLSDRMPAVAQGRAEWTVAETRHLGDCRACREEWELVLVTSRLGEGILFSRDPTPTTQAVLHRLSHEGRRPRRRVWGLAGLAAAAIVAAVWIASAYPPAAPSETGSVMAGLQLPLPELESLQPAELDSVLQTMDEPAIGSTVEDPDLDDLDGDELQRVLDSWEG